MKKLSVELLAKTVAARRKDLGLTQAALAVASGMNRSILSRLEAGDYTPSVDQLLALSEALSFDMASLFIRDEPAPEKSGRSLNIAVAGVR